MMHSTDALCSKVVAPPTIHGLAMRVLSDAYLAKGEKKEAKAALEKGLALCKPHDGRAGMPPFMKADLNGRMGDLLTALGEIERGEGNHKAAVKYMRQAVDRFETLVGAGCKTTRKTTRREMKRRPWFQLSIPDDGWRASPAPRSLTDPSSPLNLHTTTRRKPSMVIFIFIFFVVFQTSFACTFSGLSSLSKRFQDDVTRPEPTLPSGSKRVHRRDVQPHRPDAHRTREAQVGAVGHRGGGEEGCGE